MINVAIVDDDNNICVELENILIEYLKKYYLKFNIDIFYTGQEFIKYLENENIYDIVFLDIEIGNLTGIDVGKYIREKLQNEIVKIVYISSHINYAMKLFKLRPIDFLVKPIDNDELINIMHILLNLINIQYEYFEFNLDFNKCRVYLKDIIYFTTLKGSKKIYLKTINKEYLFYGKIKEIYSSLERYRFMLPHNSYVINYDYIKNIKFDKIILLNEEEVPVSKYKVKNIKELQVKFMEDMCAKNASNRIFNL